MEKGGCVKIFTANNEKFGIYGVGFAAVIIAECHVDAADYLQHELKKRGIDELVIATDIQKLPVAAGVTILCDGDY